MAVYLAECFQVMVMMLDGPAKRTKDRMLWDNSDTDDTD